MTEETPVTDTQQTETHFGRSWSGHPLEDACPCPKAPCGLVSDRSTPDCPEHSLWACKTIRQAHPASECPEAQR